MPEILVCDGTINTSDLTCSGTWLTQSYSLPFDASTLDPALIAGAIGTGFFVLVPVWAASLGVRYLINSIRG